jgi:hypothetical protein
VVRHDVVQLARDGGALGGDGLPRRELAVADDAPAAVERHPAEHHRGAERHDEVGQHLDPVQPSVPSFAEADRDRGEHGYRDQDAGQPIPLGVRGRRVHGDPQQEHELGPVAQEGTGRDGRGHDDQDDQGRAPSPRERRAGDDHQRVSERRRGLVRRRPPEGEPHDADDDQAEREQRVPDPRIDPPEAVQPAAFHGPNRTGRP